jgi:alanyl-tRNA synthetase
MKDVDPKMHSAEHILSGTLMKMFHCGRPFTTHLEKKKSKADFHFDRPLTDEETEEVERRVNDVILSDLAVSEELIPRSQAETVFDLGRLPEETGDSIRIIHIGQYDSCPCSGTHVRSTKEIGRFRIISTTFEDGALRVRFKLDGSSSQPPYL